MLNGITPLNADILQALRAMDRRQAEEDSERCAFYERAKQAYCVIQTGERRFHGCFAFREGIVPPDAE